MGIMYNHEYRVKTRDIFAQMKYVQDGQKKLLEELLFAEKKLILSTATFLKSDPSEDTLQVLSDQFTKSTAMYLRRKSDGSWICMESSQKSLEGMTFNQYVDLKEFEKKFTRNNTFVILKESWKSIPKSILVGTVKRAKEGHIDALLLIALPSEEYLAKARLGAFPTYSSFASIIDENGSVFESTNPSFEGTQTPKLTAHKHVDQGYYFSFQGERYLAVISKVKMAHFSLLLSVPASVIFSEQKDALLGFGLLLLFILVVGGIGTYLLMMRFSKPFVELSRAMKVAGDGDLKARYKPDKMGFEINALGNLFNDMVSSLKTHIEEAGLERAQKETLKRELEIGKEIQNSLVPKEFPKVPGLDIAARFAPAKEVGGDFYDLFLTKDNNVFFTVADTSGKGIFGCLYSLTFRSILRSFISEYSSLQEILPRVNALFSKDTEESSAFVTAWSAMIHPQTHKLTYSSCGHPPAILKKKNGGVEMLSTTGVAFGVMEMEKIDEKSCILEEGDFLILYSDGITEAINTHGQMYSDNRLIELIQSSKAPSATSLAGEILEEIALFSEGNAQYDDITLVVLRIETEHP